MTAVTPTVTPVTPEVPVSRLRETACGCRRSALLRGLVLMAAGRTTRRAGLVVAAVVLLGVVAVLLKQAQAQAQATVAGRGGSGGSSASTGVLVHLFEWSWADVALECEEWLGPKGFAGVQVSPPQEHIVEEGNKWSSRYAPVSYNITSRSGTQEELQDAMERCAAVGVDIIVDAVLNHGAAGSGVGCAGSPYNGDNRTYVMYSQDELHHDADDLTENCVISDYYDKDNVQLCDLNGLPDLATENPETQATIAAYLNSLTAIGAAGFRLDAAKHQDADDLGTILDMVVPAAPGTVNTWYFSEVIDGDPTEAVTPDMYYDIGFVTEFNFADDLDNNIIPEGKMQYLDTFGEAWGLIPSDKAVVFMDNHDTQRDSAQLTYKNGTLYEFGNLFMLAYPYGVHPKVMSSYYFDDPNQGPPNASVHDPTTGEAVHCTDGINWVCEHRWAAIANMVAWRNSAGDADYDDWQQGNDNQIAFSRNSAAFVALNRDEESTGGSEWQATLQTGLTAGDYCNVIESDDPTDCPAVTVDADGFADVVVPTLSAVALHTGARLF